jgi:indolepyruvate ferredoxin oxidoreductase
MIARRSAFLEQYQDAAYAKRYLEVVGRVRAAEASRVPGSNALAEAATRYLFKLMAYKDEYEVARLYAGTDFVKRVGEQFEGDYKLTFHLAPPILAKADPVTGEPRKRTYGPWMMSAFGVLAKLKFLRGTALDPFGRTHERRTERALIEDYVRVLDELAAKLDAGNLSLAVEIASIPEHIRGYGPVKERHLEEAKGREAALIAQWRDPAAARRVAIPVRAAA